MAAELAAPVAVADLGKAMLPRTLDVWRLLLIAWKSMACILSTIRLELSYRKLVVELWFTDGSDGIYERLTFCFA
jgi:hypothetical protein